ncbi:hypothetical protein [Staphylococcus gallinarum]|uniref:hypothetical protein n=1 Tax=Staphylococcus gallinarum TaxID=1293 RepID=UPI001C1FF080|nr:hypothetical protein [Staphylococcus gallinarum]MBU7218730.1 hypothetical protein [Staphylococcus gallinarum]
MNNQVKLKIIQEVLSQVNEELGFALNTDESSKITKTIKYNGKQYQIQMTREDFLELTLLEVSKKLEDINFSHI